MGATEVIMADFYFKKDPLSCMRRVIVEKAIVNSGRLVRAITLIQVMEVES